MLRIVLFFILTLLPITVLAEPTRFSSEGHEYAISCSDSGYTLKSKNPVSRPDRFATSGAEQLRVTNIETLYLGRSCDTFSHQLGAGKWCWANGGILTNFVDNSLEFDRISEISFGRQELNCPIGQSINWPNGTEDYQNCACGLE